MSFLIFFISIILIGGQSVTKLLLWKYKKPHLHLALFSNYFELVVSINHRSSLIVFMLVLYLGCFTELNLTQNIFSLFQLLYYILIIKRRKRSLFTLAEIKNELLTQRMVYNLTFIRCS